MTCAPSGTPNVLPGGKPNLKMYESWFSLVFSTRGKVTELPYPKTEVPSGTLNTELLYIYTIIIIQKIIYN